MANEPGRINPNLADKLVAAHQALAEARKERDALIVKAMKDGASLRLLAELLGMSQSGIRKIAIAGGWSAEAFHARARADHDRVRRWYEQTGDDAFISGTRPLATDPKD